MLHAYATLHEINHADAIDYSTDRVTEYVDLTFYVDLTNEMEQ